MPKIKAVITDLDHSYLLGNFIPKENIEHTHKLKSKGILVFGASGRPPYSSESVLKEHGLKFDALSGFNGSIAKFNDEILIDSPIDKEISKAMYQNSKMKSGGLFHTPHSAHKSEHERWMDIYCGKTGFKLTHSKINGYQVYMIEFNEDHSKGINMELIKEITDYSKYKNTLHFNIATVGKKNGYSEQSMKYMMITKKSKGDAVISMLNRAGIMPEETVILEDNLNGLSMLEIPYINRFVPENVNPELTKILEEKGLNYQTTRAVEKGSFIDIYNFIKQNN